MGFEDVESAPLLQSSRNIKLDASLRSKKIGIWVSLIFSSFAIFLFVISLQTKQTKSSLNFLGFRSQSLPPLRFEITNDEYPPVQSLEYYPWNYLAEPYRTSKLRISTPQSNAKYTWIITVNNEPSEPALDYFVENEEASEISAVFNKAGFMYTVQVIEEGGAYRSFQTEVICKYVRREIRDLTAADRETYLDALHIFYTISKEEGREKYGERFIVSKDLTMKHIQQFNTPDGTPCTPWHHGNTFITAHMTFMFWVEQALQSINETIAMPYWDYIKDAEQYVAWFEDSPIFTEEYFGAYQSYPYEVGGRWADVQYSMIDGEHDLVDTRHNSYGVMTDWYNNNNDTTLHRSDKLCGLKLTRTTMPRCNDLHEVLTSFSLESSHYFFENSIHNGGLHTLLGGIWDCTENYAEIFENWPPEDNLNTEYFRFYMEEFLLNAQSTWDMAYFEEHYYAPSFCSPEVPFEDCRYRCKGVGDVSELNDQEVMYYLTNLDFLHTYSRYMEYENTTRNNEISSFLKFKYVDTATDKLLKRHLLELDCHPAKMAQFSSPLGSTDDPIFSVIHSYFAIYWDYLLLTKDPDFSLEWDDDTQCHSHAIHDILPPEWFGFFGEAQDKDHNLTYTNFDMLKIFHPNNAHLPYLHADFSWDYCANKDHSDLHVKPKMYLDQVNRSSLPSG